MAIEDFQVIFANCIDRATDIADHMSKQNLLGGKSIVMSLRSSAKGNSEQSAFSKIKHAVELGKSGAVDTYLCRLSSQVDIYTLEDWKHVLAGRYMHTICVDLGMLKIRISFTYSYPENVLIIGSAPM